MEKLQPFSPSELQLMISGEQVPQWTKEDVLSYTEPKYGFTRDSPVYQRFVNVLADMSGEEKKVYYSQPCISLRKMNREGLTCTVSCTRLAFDSRTTSKGS